jgi:hypothetical protein
MSESGTGSGSKIKLIGSDEKEELLTIMIESISPCWVISNDLTGYQIHLSPLALIET